MRCPICGSREFKGYNGREAARCAGCGALERTRFQYMLMTRMQLLRPGMRILHIAPEPALGKLFHSLSGPLYHAADIDPVRLSGHGFPVHRIDLCCDLEVMPRYLFDLIVHNHVLEHIPCSVSATLKQLQELLRPGGYHIFSVTFRGRTTDEDLNDIPVEERVARFGQSDHMRIFGTDDFPSTCSELGIEIIDPYHWLTPAELHGAGVPYKRGDRPSGHSQFLGRRY